MASTKSFILGIDKSPNWFNEEAKKGRARAYYDDNNNLEYVRIVSGINNYEAHKGDMILMSKSGLVVMPKEKVQKNNVKQNKENED